MTRAADGPPSTPSARPASRDPRIDALRGLGILLVVAGHALIRALGTGIPGMRGVVDLAGIGPVPMTPVASAMLSAIYSFHMPLLAFVSGLALSHTERLHGRRFISRRAQALLVPYFVWLLIAWLISGPHSAGGLIAFAGRAALDPQSPGGLWFLYALFMSMLVLAIVDRFSPSEVALVVSAVLVGLCGILPLGSLGNIFGLSDVAWLYPFVVAGLLVARRESALSRSRYALPVALVVWLVTLPLISPIVVPGPRWWASSLTALLASAGAPPAALVVKAAWAVLREICALAGVLVAYLAIRLLPLHLLKAPSWLGRRTLGVYATHSQILLWLAPVAASAMVGPRFALLFTLGLALSLAVTLGLERTPATRRALLGMR